MDKKILVGIVMGSDSDLPVMQETANILDKFGIGYEINIISAHRTPQRAHEYASSAEERGLEVIIAGAGGAAHLAGVIASMTPLPVIGVPMQTQLSGGLDSLLSIVQMPSGVPVATVAVGKAGAKNAGILTAQQILGVKFPEIREKVKEYKEEIAQELNKQGNYKVEFINLSDEILEMRYFDDCKDERCRSWKMPRAVAEELVSWQKKFKQSKIKKFPIKEKTKICEFNMNTEKSVEVREFDGLGRYKMTGWSLPKEVVEELINWDGKSK